MSAAGLWSAGTPPSTPVSSTLGLTLTPPCWPPSSPLGASLEGLAAASWVTGCHAQATDTGSHLVCASSPSSTLDQAGCTVNLWSFLLGLVPVRSVDYLESTSHLGCLYKSLCKMAPHGACMGHSTHAHVVAASSLPHHHSPLAPAPLPLPSCPCP